ncbi:type I secretion membrane fusion protein, HlyD family [Caulobacter sp. AP07]|uniref:HlyD family type I secretion periplasmic adaptor subunit n=1 Tax=Caulobacter sp. AP07 TaxID=1144304 RepID=UPI00027216B2|nr:HlyD family type I secretion periplasmic adaptor subunit [Caulobacter sp. AP07]EJL21735.1 type I secretion membrane fusion protein, HlyD family [Caulobacter sp. AP07]
MTLAERFPGLTRHWTVLKAAWRDQDQAARNRRSRSDTEFLPAALEIIETPPSPGLRYLMLALCGLFAIALAWSTFGRLDVVAVAAGKVIPIANVKLIQPLEIGVVRAIHVHDGQHVSAGQLLVELDPTMTGADEAQASRGLQAATIAQARSQAIIAYLGGRPGRFVAPPGISADVAAVQVQFVDSQLAEYAAKRGALVEARAQHGEELTTALTETAKLRETLPLVDQQLEARRQLSEKGYFSRLKMLEYEQLRIEHVKNIDIQMSSAAKARAAIAAIDSQMMELRQALLKSAASDLAEAGDNASLRTEELRKSTQRKTFQALRAPVSGTVQQLAVHTIGGVVQPAQALIVIVPDGSDYEVEARILNKDIGFIREGQSVRVKLEAFPFTDYGLIEGEVRSVTRDAIQDEKLGLVYATRIRLACASGRAEVAPLCARVGAGMAVQAEIRTGSRRILQYLLSPISKSLDEAGRER